MSQIRVGIIYGQGINADVELGWAFELCGIQIKRFHVLEILHNPNMLNEVQILAFPGGFSFGDYLGSGRVLGLELQELQGRFEDFIQNGLILGICNGFQVLVKMGLLPRVENQPKVEASLDVNQGGFFIDRWVRVEFNPDSVCVWTQGLRQTILPIRHGEGKFTTSSLILEKLHHNRQIALRYAPGENPNGSLENIAGVCDPTGRVLGLMPHPEAFLELTNSPLRRRNPELEMGLAIFKNAVNFLK